MDEVRHSYGNGRLKIYETFAPWHGSGKKESQMGVSQSELWKNGKIEVWKNCK